jgi:hypothetical protein
MVCKVWYICNLYQKLLYISRVFALKKYKPLKDMVFYSYIVFYIRRIIRFVFAYKQWVRKKNLLKVRSLTRDFFPKKKKKKTGADLDLNPGPWACESCLHPLSHEAPRSSWQICVRSLYKKIVEIPFFSTRCHYFSQIILFLIKTRLVLHILFTDLVWSINFFIFFLYISAGCQLTDEKFVDSQSIIVALYMIAIFTLEH